MIFEVIDGGKACVPIQADPVCGRALSALEHTQSEIVNRVAAAIWKASMEAGDLTWPEYVRRAYAEVETSPAMLCDVSDRIRAARKAIAAIRPGAPNWDHSVSQAVALGPALSDPADVVDVVQRWIEEVLK